MRGGVIRHSGSTISSCMGGMTLSSVRLDKTGHSRIRIDRSKSQFQHLRTALDVRVVTEYFFSGCGGTRLLTKSCFAREDLGTRTSTMGRKFSLTLYLSKQRYENSALSNMISQKQVGLYWYIFVRMWAKKVPLRRFDELGSCYL